MNLDPHVEQLKQKHAHLESAIEEEAHRPHPDDLRLTDLKRQKLRIKDEIARLK
jgi:hypothetical protein